MKKSSVIIIVLIFIASVVIINFYGLKMKVYNPTYYVEKIQCLNEEANLKAENEYEIIIPYSTGLVYQIYYKVLPEDADNRTVKFIYDTSKTTATVDRYGKVIFHRSGAINVYIRSSDGSEVVSKVKIMAY